MAQRVKWYDQTLEKAAPWSLCERCATLGSCPYRERIEHSERGIGGKLLTAECEFFEAYDNGKAAETPKPI